jgi:hypothetical protein
MHFGGQFVSPTELPNKVWFLLTRILIKWIREGGVAGTTLLHLVRKLKKGWSLTSTTMPKIIVASSANFLGLNYSLREAAL